MDTIVTDHMTEILPRLHVGDFWSCEHYHKSFDATLCVLEQPHAGNQRCQHTRILDPASMPMVRIDWLAAAHRWLEVAWWQERKTVLVHCSAGIERSPLTVATFLTTKMPLTLPEAYALLKWRRPIVEDSAAWLPQGWAEQVREHQFWSAYDY